VPEDVDGEIAGQSGPVESRSTADPEATRSFAVECAKLLEADKCEHVVVLDVRGRSQVAEYVIVGSGTSDRQMNSAIDDAVELGGRYGLPAMRTNKDDRSTWLLADFIDVIAHLFEPNTRAYYDIETLWGDAPRVDWKREAGGADGADA
jgi:ribosome-associated protein